MALNLSGAPFKLTPEDMGAPDYASSLLGGLQGGNNAYFQAPMQSAEIQKLKSNAFQNQMFGTLLQKAMNGEGGAGGLDGNPTNFANMYLNSKLFGTPFPMSPQQSQDLKIQGATKTAANKSNLNTGASDIAREDLQGVVSMPKEYMGFGGSIKMGLDRAAAQAGDRAAKERLIQAAVAERLVPEYSGFQLMSQGQKATVPALQHQQAAIRQGWPYLSHGITGNLTPEMQKEVERRHNEAVRQVNRKREGFLNSGGKREQDGSSDKRTDNTSKYNWEDIRHTAKLKNLTENQVIERLAKMNGVDVDQIMEMIKAEGQ